MNLSKDLVAASAVPLLLAILSRGESYGYEIIQQVRQVSQGELDWTEGMLYPVLHRLEDQGWLETFWATSDRGRRRKYYRISDKGQQELREQKTRWAMVNATLDRVWGRDEEDVCLICNEKSPSGGEP